jgi:hypothetical protein
LYTIFDRLIAINCAKNVTNQFYVHLGKWLTDNAQVSTWPYTLLRLNANFCKLLLTTTRVILETRLQIVIFPKKHGNKWNGWLHIWNVFKFAWDQLTNHTDFSNIVLIGHSTNSSVIGWTWLVIGVFHSVENYINCHATFVTNTFLSK